MRPDFWLGAAAALILALILMMLSPERRAYGRGSAALLVFVLAAELTELLLAHYGQAPATAIARGIASITLGVILIRLLGYLLFRVVLPVAGANLPRIVGDLVVSAAIVGWGFLWLRNSGVDFGSLVATSAVVTGILVFSMQETIGNIMGGVALQADDSIRVGDWIRFDDVNGRVVEVRWRFTAVETNDRETVVVPNSYLVKNRFSIVGRRNDPETRWRRTVAFSVSLDVAPARVCEALERALKNAQIPNVVQDPPPSALLLDVVPGAGHYGLRYWLVDPQEEDPTNARVRAHCLAALQRHEMRLAVPVAQTVLIHQDREQREADQAEEFARRIDALSRVDLFAHLAPEELRHLAGHMVAAPFLAGTVMVHQGDVAHWLYLLLSGEAEVWVEADGQGTRRVSTIQAGGFFGEMGLLTGAPRNASVIAETDVTCYRLGKDGFGELLRARPELASEVSQIMLNRSEELERLKGQIHHAAAGAPESLLKRIRSFFRLGDPAVRTPDAAGVRPAPEDLS